MTDLKKHVTSLELSKKLHEHGLKKESCFMWVRNDEDHYKPGWSVFANSPYAKRLSWCRRYNAYLASELGEILPSSNMFWDVCNRGYIQNTPNDYHCRVFEGTGKKDKIHNSFDYSISNAMAKMLIHLIKNDLVKVEDLND